MLDFVSQGGISAGTRAVQALKPIATALKMMPLFEQVAIPFVAQLMDDDGQFRATDALERSATTMLDELLRWDVALRPLRARTLQTA